jgi:histidinol-phosphate phosphatase family protein
MDRDGVINKDRGYDYTRSWEDFIFLPGVKETLALLHEMHVPVVVITNQSCIGKGLVSREAVDDIHARMMEEIEKSGGHIGGVYLCPHTDDDRCDCRKPLPGLILEAARDLDADLGNSLMVGDSMRDIQAGQNAGTHTAIILSGKGAEELPKARQQGVRPDYVLETMGELCRVVQPGRAPGGKDE